MIERLVSANSIHTCEAVFSGLLTGRALGRKELRSERGQM
jgi:hypothetical protein